MSAPAWLGIAGWWLLAVIFVLALCRAAGRADDAMEAEQRDRENVVQFPRERRRSHTRNGIGGNGTAA